MKATTVALVFSILLVFSHSTAYGKAKKAWVWQPGFPGKWVQTDTDELYKGCSGNRFLIEFDDEDSNTIIVVGLPPPGLTHGADFSLHEYDPKADGGIGKKLLTVESQREGKNLGNTVEVSVARRRFHGDTTLKNKLQVVVCSGRGVLTNGFKLD